MRSFYFVFSETMKLIADYHSEFGDLFRVKAFNIIAFMTIDPNIIEIILRSNTKYLAKNRMYKNLLYLLFITKYIIYVTYAGMEC